MSALLAEAGITTPINRVPLAQRGDQLPLAFPAIIPEPEVLPQEEAVQRVDRLGARAERRTPDGRYAALSPTRDYVPTSRLEHAPQPARPPRWRHSSFKPECRRRVRRPAAAGQSRRRGSGGLAR